MRLRRHFDLEESHSIDLAPMLDFVLNLLIFFIITAVFAKEFGLSVSRPSASFGAPSKEAGSLLIAITAAGEILIEDRQVDVRAVRRARRLAVEEQAEGNRFRRCGRQHEVCVAGVKAKRDAPPGLVEHHVLLAHGPLPAEGPGVEAQLVG